MIKFEISSQDAEIISLIANRAIGLTNGGFDKKTVRMDLTACHEVNSLNLKKLLEAPENDFLHDIRGINRHLDHGTGELQDCFWPRCGSLKVVTP